MYEYCNVDGHVKQKNIAYENVLVLPSTKHIFSHKEWHMVGYMIVMKEKLDGFIWVTKEQIRNDYSLPSAFKLYTSIILED